MTRESLPRDLIHLLNQRYFEQWQRAQRLEEQLSRKRSILTRLLARIRRFLVPGRDIVAPGMLLGESAAPASGRVSVIIPFRDRRELLVRCLRSLRGSHDPVELILVDNGSTDRRLLRWLGRLEQRGSARVLTRNAPFNFSWLCNQAAEVATGEHLLFLNNDTEALTRDWLVRMLAVLAHPEVGIVGATLVYPDGTLQHAGLNPRSDGRWVHPYRGLAASDSGLHGELAHVRAVPAVTGACLLIRKTLFDQLGGFDEQLPLTYNDVDLCLRARAMGSVVAITPHARLLHYEGLSRGYSQDEPGQCHLEALQRFPAMS